MTYDLRLGRWQDVLADVECDALFADPPYGARTHDGQRHGRRDPAHQKNYDPRVSTRGLGYEHWTPDDVQAFVAHWSPRTRGWMACMTSHDLAPAWAAAFESVGRYAFAPLPCLLPGMNVRLAGDGPSSWTVWLMVARPRRLQKWRTLPGGYYGSCGAGVERAKLPVAGAKPEWLMRALIRDYSRPGDLVCDPCAGGGTTLLAAVQTGRRAVGSEMDPQTHAKAVQRLANAKVTVDWLDAPQAVQEALL